MRCLNAGMLASGFQGNRVITIDEVTWFRWLVQDLLFRPLSMQSFCFLASNFVGCIIGVFIRAIL